MSSSSEKRIARVSLRDPYIFGFRSESSSFFAFHLLTIGDSDTNICVACH